MHHVAAMEELADVSSLGTLHFPTPQAGCCVAAVPGSTPACSSCATAAMSGCLYHAALFSIAQLWTARQQSVLRSCTCSESKLQLVTHPHMHRLRKGVREQNCSANPYLTYFPRVAAVPCDIEAGYQMEESAGRQEPSHAEDLEDPLSGGSERGCNGR